MIMITLKLYVTLVKYLPENSENLEIPEEITIKNLFANYGIPEELVKLIFVNGKSQDSSYILRNNDRVGLFPPIGGG